MKRSIFYFICLCLPLVTLSSEEKQKDTVIPHDTCQIQIYSNFNDLTDPAGAHIEYNTDTKTDIESLFINKGYHPVTGKGKSKPMVFIIESTYIEGVTAKISKDSSELKSLLCWAVVYAIANENNEAVHSDKYGLCQESPMTDDKERQVLMVEEMMLKADYDYNTRLYLDAIINHKTKGKESNSFNTSGYSFSDSIDAVLLGVREPMRKKYGIVPADLGILKSIPYCCTPQDHNEKCLKMRKINTI